MKDYKFLLFDLDDTLLDFGAAEDLALKLLFQELGFPLTDQVEGCYKRINQRLWGAFEEGKMDRNEVVNTRFSLLFKEYNKEVDGALLEKQYRTFLEQGHQRVEGAFELITFLHNKYDLYIVSNGVSRTQHKRLRDSGLEPFFKGMFVSEDVGYQKPMKEFFENVFAAIPGFSVKQGLIIGDSLSADIKGGYLAGLDTCWLNPEKKPNNTAILPTYQIQRLDELPFILNGLNL